jgi:dihydrolipoamide dehydrogenase
MYDLTIIGAGWAGFNGALRAKELGLKVCLIDKANLGGTCLNLGCIPTKALIQSAKVYSLVRKSASFGIEIPAASVNFSKIQERKNKIVAQLSAGMRSKLTGIDYINGEAKIISRNEIKCGQELIKTKSILIASGSRPAQLAGFEYDGEKILSSNDILGLKEIPESLLIIGGGVIGCEFAGLFSIFGCKVTIAEKLPRLLPGEDAEIARKLETIFKKKGIEVLTGADAGTLKRDNYSLILVCVGRVPDTQGLGLENVGITPQKGKIAVDEYMKSEVDNIFAAGDCTGKNMLAHFASYQSGIAAENIANPGNLRPADNANIPACVFTDPEIASVGLCEEKAAEKGLEIQVHKFDFLGSGMARISEETEGFIKIISDKKSKEIVGGAIIGPRATELIASINLAVSNHLTLRQLQNTVFAHPTFSESISEALRREK